MSNFNRRDMHASIVPERAWQRLFRADAATKQLGRCRYCRDVLTAENISADHAIPRSRGGTTTRANIKAACIACNITKGSMTVAAFAEVIANPPPGCSIHFWLAFFRRRINNRIDRMRDRLGRAVGTALQ